MVERNAMLRRSSHGLGGRLRSWAIAAGAEGALMLGTADHQANAAKDDRLVIAIEMDFNSLDPARTFCIACQIFMTGVYETVVEIGPDNKEIKPGLAKSWDVSDDQTRFTFHLDPAARFADGSPVEAKDVKWSWERLHNVKGGAAYLADAIATVEAPDPQTVIATLAAPNSEFLGILTAVNLAVVNSDVASEHGASAAADADKVDTAETWLLENSAGSGPYILAGYKPNEELRLTRNEAYWGAKAAFKEVVFQHVPNPVAQAQMLESGAADIAMNVDAESATKIHSADVVVRPVSAFNIVHLSLYPLGDEHLRDKRVRQAISYALDYQGIIDATLGGKGDHLVAPIPNGFPGTSGLKPADHDPEKAKQLLKEAGLADGLKLLAKYPDIKPFGVDLSIMMQKIQQDFAEVGITLDLEPLPINVWREQRNAKKVAVTPMWFASDYYGSGQAVPFFGMVEGSWHANFAGISEIPDLANKRLPDLYAKALASTGPAQEELFAEVFKEMMSDVIILPLMSPKQTLTYRKNVTGMHYSVCCNLILPELSLQ
jgi:peptide/nickel transport system substrate-binding protein